VPVHPFCRFRQIHSVSQQAAALGPNITLVCKSVFAELYFCSLQQLIFFLRVQPLG
jgi:hypothetical protein